jgi:hypothetical protein
MNDQVDLELYQVIGAHNSDIASLKKDIQEIKDNQKVFVEFVTEQKAGRKFIWLLFGTLASVATFGKEVLQAISSFLSFKGIR